MAGSERRPGRRAEIDAILERKPGVAETRDEADRYTVVGAASRSTFENWLTPIEEHFVCHRNAIPEPSGGDTGNAGGGDGEGSWTVSFTGDLDGELAVAEIVEAFPTVAVAHTMECAGNGRGQHDPETGSVQWGAEAVATAVWTGTPVSSLLRAQGVGPEAGDRDDGSGERSSRWLTAVGGDSLEDEEAFARSIPLSKAIDDAIVAYGMNGEALPAEHGHPVRLIVPGWYGVNSVKWLDELRLMDSMVVEGSLDRPGTHARWQQSDYRLHPAGEKPTPHGTVSEVDTTDQLESPAVEHPYTFDETVMSLIGRPDGEGPVRPGTDGAVTIRGVAWAGEDGIERVEVSTDGGETWSDAALVGPDYPGAWRLFERSWTADPGTHTLASRATDERGRRQPARISAPEEWETALEDDEFPWNEGGYAANAYLPNAFAVDVEAGSRD